MHNKSNDTQFLVPHVAIINVKVAENDVTLTSFLKCSLGLKQLASVPRKSTLENQQFILEKLLLPKSAYLYAMKVGKIAKN